MLWANKIPKVLWWLILAGFLIRFALAFVPDKTFVGMVYDDAYYYFSVAKVLVNQGIWFSADGITKTNGFHPLWLALVTPLWYLLEGGGEAPVRMVIVLAAILDTIAALLLFVFLRRFFAQWIALVLTGFYLFNPVGISQAVSGMETALNSLMVILLIGFPLLWESGFREETWGLRRWSIWFGVVCGLAILTRTDNVFLVGGMLVYCWYSFWKDGGWGWQKNGLWTVGICGLIVAPWFIANWIVLDSAAQGSAWAYPWVYHNEFIAAYGTYWTTALLAKMYSILRAQWLLIGAYFGSPLFLGGLIGMFVMFVLAKHPYQRDVLRRVREYMMWPWIGVGVYLFFHLGIRWFPRVWYQQPLYIVLLPLVGVVLVGLENRKARKRIGYVVIGCLLCAASFYHTTTALNGVSGAFKRAWVKQQRALVAVQLVNSIVPKGEIVGAWNSGFVMYYADRPVINLDGLANGEVLKYYKNGEPLAYLRERNVKWIVDCSFFFKWTYGKYFGQGVLDKYMRVRRKVEGIGFRNNDMWLVKVLSEEEVLAAQTATVPEAKSVKVGGEG